MLSDLNGDTLVCSLDVDNDGATDYTINDCANITSQAHTYSAAGDYTAQLTVSDGITAPVQNTRGLTVLPPLSTDVSVNGSAIAGDRLLYTITVGNVSPTPIDGVNVSTTIPDLNISWTENVEPDPTSCSGDICEWSLGTLAVGESRTITVNALVDATLLNGAAVDFPVTFSATGMSDIQIDKAVEVYNPTAADFILAASTDPVTPNETFTYNLEVGNVSAGALTTLQLRASLPVGVTVASISDGGTEVSAGEVAWDVASLGVGASLHREVTVVADASLVAGHILQASARLTHDGGLTIDNTAESALTVVSSALPLSVDISTSANPIVAGKRAFYTLTVSNTSLSPIDSVTVLLRVPAGLSFYKNQNAEPDVVCRNSRCDPAEEALWSLGTLVAGESRTITVDTLADAALLSGNLISVPVRVTATGLGDDIDRLTTVVVNNSRSADFALSASTDPVSPNETFTYNLDVGNVDTSALTALQLRVSLPSGVTVADISDGGTEMSAGEIVWNVASLGVGSSLHREVTVTANAGLSAGRILRAHALLTHDSGLEIDDASGQAVTVLLSPPLLNVDVSTTGPVVAGERMLYTLTLSNASLLPTSDVNVLLRLPAGLSLESGQRNVDPIATFEGCGSASCSGAATVNWNLGTLAAGESRTITANIGGRSSVEWQPDRDACPCHCDRNG